MCQVRASAPTGAAANTGRNAQARPSGSHEMLSILGDPVLLSRHRTVSVPQMRPQADSPIDSELSLPLLVRGLAMRDS